MKIEYNEKYNFYKVTSDNWLTPYKDGDDIRSYYATKEVYSPTDKIDFREITESEHQEYLNKQENDNI